MTFDPDDRPGGFDDMRARADAEHDLALSPDDTAVSVGASSDPPPDRSTQLLSAD